MGLWKFDPIEPKGHKQKIRRLSPDEVVESESIAKDLNNAFAKLSESCPELSEATTAITSAKKKKK